MTLCGDVGIDFEPCEPWWLDTVVTCIECIKVLKHCEGVKYKEK